MIYLLIYIYRQPNGNPDDVQIEVFSELRDAKQAGRLIWRNDFHKGPNPLEGTWKRKNRRCWELRHSDSELYMWIERTRVHPPMKGKTR